MIGDTNTDMVMKTRTAPLPATTLAVLTFYVSLSFALSNVDLRLIEAVQNRDHSQIKALMKQPIDLDITQPNGTTALAWAVHLQDHAIAKLLLTAKVNVNTRDEYGDSPLTLACFNGDSHLVQKLLEAAPLG